MEIPQIAKDSNKRDTPWQPDKISRYGQGNVPQGYGKLVQKVVTMN